MRHPGKITAALLSVMLIMAIIPVPAFAAQGNTSKEEVVYINLNADGSVDEIYVVNSFDPDSKGKIVDYGKYESLRNMTTTDKISYNGDKITVNAGAEKLYYEGKLKENVIPWTVSVKYFMDGKEYSARDIAGRDGALEIRISIKENKECRGSFFEGYALQASLTLDTENATAIKADGATIANVGSDKQITYTILPGNEKDISVTADVQNFEMSGISINGIRMNLDIDFDDSSLQNRIDEVIEAVKGLDRGAGELNNGAYDLYHGTEKLNAAAGEVYAGAGSLYRGAVELKEGLAAIASRNVQLTDAAMSAYKALCTAAETQLNAQLSENGLETVTLTPDTYADVLMGVLAEMDADAVYNKAYNAALAQVTAQVEAQADSLYSGYISAQADSIYLAYVKSQADSLYSRIAAETVRQQLIENGMSEEQAQLYLQTEEGKALVSGTVSAMTDEQKSQILDTAVQSLTPDQKNQILQGALASLTEEQKKEIRDGYIMQMMASDDVTVKINEAVEAVDSASAKVSALKGQLDSYGAFYAGLVDYTGAVSSAAKGACELASGMSSLYDGTDELKKAVGSLHIAIGKLNDGTDELKNGTNNFAEKTLTMDSDISDEIDSITSSLTGRDVKVVSFASGKNTNTESVQFVMRTEKIKSPEPSEAKAAKAEKMTFWQKLISLFR